MEADCHKFKAIVSSRAFTYFVYIALLTATLVCVVIVILFFPLVLRRVWVSAVSG